MRRGVTGGIPWIRRIKLWLQRVFAMLTMNEVLPTIETPPLIITCLVMVSPETDSQKQMVTLFIYRTRGYNLQDRIPFFYMYVIL